MKAETEKITWNKDKEELAALLNQLPKWRLEKALSYHFDTDKYLCAKSFLLLKKMLFEEYRLKTVPPFSYTKTGKPYFKEYPDIHFNLSHCKSGIACVIDNKPVGIDIEEIFFDKNIAETILSQEELEAVKKAVNSKQEFVKFWTKKESFLKLTGEGIVDDMKNVLKDCYEKVEFTTSVDKSFITTVAFEKIKE